MCEILLSFIVVVVVVVVVVLVVVLWRMWWIAFVPRRRAVAHHAWLLTGAAVCIGVWLMQHKVEINAEALLLPSQACWSGPARGGKKIQGTSGCVYSLLPVMITNVCFAEWGWMLSIVSLSSLFDLSCVCIRMPIYLCRLFLGCARFLHLFLLLDLDNLTAWLSLTLIVFHHKYHNLAL